MKNKFQFFARNKRKIISWYSFLFVHFVKDVLPFLSLVHIGFSETHQKICDLEHLYAMQVNQCIKDVECYLCVAKRCDLSKFTTTTWFSIFHMICTVFRNMNQNIYIRLKCIKFIYASRLALFSTKNFQNKIITQIQLSIIFKANKIARHTNKT